MQTYDFGIFTTLKGELVSSGIERVFPVPIPTNAINDNEPYVTINIESIKQAMGLRAQVVLEVTLHNASRRFKSKALATLEDIFCKRNCVLLQEGAEIGSVSFRSDGFNNEKNTITIEAFLILKRMYDDE